MFVAITVIEEKTNDFENGKDGPDETVAADGAEDAIGPDANAGEQRH